MGMDGLENGSRREKDEQFSSYSRLLHSDKKWDWRGSRIYQYEKRANNSQAFLRLLNSGCKWNWMGWRIDQFEKRTSNYQAFQDFCNLIANEIGWVGE
jgi:hypothetical protein